VRQLNQIAEREIGLYLDGIRFGLITASMAFDRIRAALSRLGDNPLHSPPLEDALTLANDCWLMLDSTDRTRQIVDKFKLLSHSMPERKQYLLATRGIRKLRNAYHHIEDLAAHISEKSSSIYGGIFWVSFSNDQLMHALILKSGVVQSSYGGLTYDTFERRFTSRIQFQAYGHEIDLIEIAGENENFSLALEELLESRGISTTELMSSFRFSVSMDTLNKIVDVDNKA